ncbi:MAG: hypothetical protein IPP94_16515 [Ignavibacteria bacterium]|nr:hypothetical protein [Ignavibacteria bacterium]
MSRKHAVPAAFLLLVMTVAGAAQTDTQDDLNAALRSHIGLIAKPTNAGVVLRWAVDKPAVWLIAKKTGFILERADAVSGGRMPAASAFRALSAGPVLPWSGEQWRKHFENSPTPREGVPDYAMIAAALLEDEDASSGGPVSTDDLAALKEQRAQFEMRYSFALFAADRSAAAAEGLGLRLMDAGAEAGKTYVYRIRLAGTSPVYRVDTGYVTVRNTPARDVQKELLRADGRDGTILLLWPRAKEYSAYRVERSADKGRTYEAMTSAPLLSVRDADAADSVESFADTTIVNYRPYTYRVFGFTAFADEDLVGTITANGRDRTPPGTPFVPNAKQIAARAVRIQWSMDEPTDGDLAGFRVLRDSVEDGPYRALTDRPFAATAREFIDTTFFEDRPNYYIVVAVDTAGNEARSLPSYVAIADSTPPLPPRWERGSMDSLGVVTLVLRANREGDCAGYRILRANAPDHEFSSIIEWFGEDDGYSARDTVIVDTVTVLSLTKNVYYRATALDRNFNESEPSDILVVRRPDKIAPVAPVIHDVEVSDTSVVLHFYPSASEDVQSHRLYRRGGGSDAWKEIATLGGDAVSSLDRDVERNVVYEYALEAVDSAGLRSEMSVSVQARPYDTGVRPGITGLQATVDADGKRVTLNWKNPALKEVFQAFVYRSVRGNGLRKYAAVQGDAAPTVSDSSLQGDGVYEYAVKIVTASGAESKLSAPVQVTVEKK